MPIAGVVRDLLKTGLKKFDLTKEYEPDTRSAITFRATDEFLEDASKAAMLNGTSVNALYIQLLCESLEVTPCLVVEEAEEQVTE